MRLNQALSLFLATLSLFFLTSCSDGSPVTPSPNSTQGNGNYTPGTPPEFDGPGEPTAWAPPGGPTSECQRFFEWTGSMVFTEDDEPPVEYSDLSGDIIITDQNCDENESGVTVVFIVVPLPQRSESAKRRLPAEPGTV